MWEGIKTWLTVVAGLFGAAIVLSLFGLDKLALLLAHVAGAILGIGLRILAPIAGFFLLSLLAYVFIFLPADKIRKYKLVRRN